MATDSMLAPKGALFLLRDIKENKLIGLTCYFFERV